MFQNKIEFVHKYDSSDTCNDVLLQFFLKTFYLFKNDTALKKSTKISRNQVATTLYLSLTRETIGVDFNQISLSYFGKNRRSLVLERILIAQVYGRSISFAEAVDFFDQLLLESFLIDINTIDPELNLVFDHKNIEMLW